MKKCKNLLMGWVWVAFSKPVSNFQKRALVSRKPNPNPGNCYPAQVLRIQWFLTKSTLQIKFCEVDFSFQPDWIRTTTSGVQAKEFMLQIQGLAGGQILLCHTFQLPRAAGISVLGDRPEQSHCGEQKLEVKAGRGITEAFYTKCLAWCLAHRKQYCY